MKCGICQRNTIANSAAPPTLDAAVRRGPADERRQRAGHGADQRRRAACAASSACRRSGRSTSVASASAAASRFARAREQHEAGSRRAPARRARASAARHAAVRQRPQPRPPHQRVGVALVDLVQHRRAAGDERRARDRLRHRRQVGATRGRRGSSPPRWSRRPGSSAAAWSARRSRRARLPATALGIGTWSRRRARASFTRAPPRRADPAEARTLRYADVRRSRTVERLRLQPAVRPRIARARLRSVSTSDVVSTSAPQTTCRLLIQTSRAAQHRQRAERDLHGDERDDAAPPAASARGGRGGATRRAPTSRATAA